MPVEIYTYTRKQIPPMFYSMFTLMFFLILFVMIGMNIGRRGTRIGGKTHKSLKGT